MQTNDIDGGMDDIHLVMQLLQTLDVGLAMIDRQYRIQLWNSFMESHSGIHTGDAMGADLFTLFPELPQQWLKSKIDAAFSLQIRSYSVWQLHSRLFDFKSSRPLTGDSQMMYQNVSLIPITGANKEVSRVGLIVYDVTDTANSKLELEQANRSLERLSRTDPLSGLYNRGFWEECLAAEFRRDQRSGNPASLVLLDIDHFKPINDSLGHQAGDEVIRQVARLITKSLRVTDMAGRYGGEEFAVILPDTAAREALVLAERLREAIAAATIRCDEDDVCITISLGISEFSPAFTDHRQWIESADQALYHAKAQGRNLGCLRLGGERVLCMPSGDEQTLASNNSPPR